MVLKELRDEIYRTLPNKCVYCGCSEKIYLNIDHKVPKTKGGTDNIKNLQLTCIICNKIKSNMSHKDFIRYMKSIRTLDELNLYDLQINIVQKIYHSEVTQRRE